MLTLSYPTKRAREDEMADGASEGEALLRRKKIKPLCLRPSTQQDQTHSFTALPTPEAQPDEYGIPKECNKPIYSGRPKMQFHTLSPSDGRLSTEADADLEMTDCLSAASTSHPVWSSYSSQSKYNDAYVHSPTPSHAIIDTLELTGIHDHRSTSPRHLHSTSNTVVDQVPSGVSHFHNSTIHPFISRDNTPFLKSQGEPSSIQATNPMSYSSSTNPEIHGLHDSLENTITQVPPTTTKPSKKGSIAMGFRADCDKCQRRVPGHYSHI
ncbi:hypothetical protein FQN49_008709, partial [Arthroderma sp. PD_2]